jgi:hypothetical protein
LAVDAAHFFSGTELNYDKNDQVELHYLMTLPTAEFIQVLFNVKVITNGG